jgi:hypothetical protein
MKFKRRAYRSARFSHPLGLARLHAGAARDHQITVLPFLSTTSEDHITLLALLFRTRFSQTIFLIHYHCFNACFLDDVMLYGKSKCVLRLMHVKSKDRSVLNRTTCISFMNGLAQWQGAHSWDTRHEFRVWQRCYVWRFYCLPSVLAGGFWDIILNLPRPVESKSSSSLLQIAILLQNSATSSICSWYTVVKLTN